ncbi:MAG TPA: ABC transporter ATP-binding protein [Oligoflexia bacterium]|nr:ABC transporter ATP-binding protein [Oligoflexia bacterium]HMR24929.1 ABC transporter ATP-binding protein [Oligoflexia bacterium]
MTQALQISNLNKSFGQQQILKDINLSLQAGEFLILVGPSGCGKSTLLNCIAGLEKPDSGDIFITDKNVTELLPKDRDIAMVFQSYALYPNMTVRDNLAFGMKMRKRSKEYIDKRIDEVAKSLEIEHLLTRKPAKLSGGQRQRVAMGRAMARTPSLFLFDEPLSNLDAKLRVGMRKEIRQLHDSQNCATVYVTHDQIEAMTLGDRVAVMKEGEVVQLDTPENIYAHPVNTYVAQFMGSPSMNIVEAEIKNNGQKKFFNLQTTDANYQLDAPEALSDYKKVLVGIRPEDITSKPSRTLNPYEVKSSVEFTEPTGADTLVHTSMNGKQVVARCRPKHVCAKGESMSFYLNQAKFLFFDPATGEKI